MEIYISEYNEKMVAVLLDDEMKIVKPVYDFLRKEAAQILGISIATLDAARQNGLISYVQYVQNGCVYFTKACLQEYIAKCTHKAVPVEKRETYRTPRAIRH